jgi:predicted lipoprotein with Yx(FWY)xxD motif
MGSTRRSSVLVAAALVAATAVLLSACGSSSGSTTPSTTSSSSSQSSSSAPFLSSLGRIVVGGSTVPANGDVNPYGIAVVPASSGKLVKGSVLVSNFNDAANVQGTGTTLVELAPNRKQTLFAKVGSLPSGQSCPGGIGLGTALAILPGGWVVVGSIPAAGRSGAPATANPAGCLIVLNSAGQVVETWSNPDINGPWDLTTSVQGSNAAIFVSNVLTRPSGTKNVPPSGSCTVVRINVTLGAGMPQMTGATVVGTGFAWQVNHATFVLGPTGLALGTNGTLYVAQTLGSHITAIPDALTRSAPITDGTSTLTSGGHLDAPLGLMLAPNGNVIAVNGNNGNAVEMTPAGQQIASATLVPNGAGALFGVTLTADGRGLAFVNDSTNAVNYDTASTHSAATATGVSAAAIGSLGSVLTGPNGRTLYYLTTESTGSIQCTGACSSTWPPLVISRSSTPTRGTGVTGTLSTVTRTDGTTQLTYNGHPVYYYSGDATSGQANGQGVKGVWFVLKPGTSAGGGATTSPTSTGSAGGANGY